VNQRSAILLIFAFLSACGMPDTGPPPRKTELPRMTKVRLRDVSPGVDAKAFAGQPVTIYRLGQQYGRVEFPNGDVVLVREPHSFYIDTSAKKAYHGLDPGPTYVFRAPIVRSQSVGEDFPPELLGLEFGREPEFLARYQARERSTSVENGVEVREQYLDFGEHSLIVTRRLDNGAPLRLGIFRNGKLGTAIQYDEWRRDLLPKGTLFSISEDLEVVEGPPPFAQEEAAAEEATPAPAEDAAAPGTDEPAADAPAPETEEPAAD
jgi:hypothetical protein